jgi:hypothetical protein
MAALSHSIDPTLAALDALHAQASGSDTPRPYLGASQIGDPCTRKLWYSFRWALTRTISASGYRAIHDGHRGERVMADWLRSIPGIQLWTMDPENDAQPIGFQDCAGHFRGHLDGIILGLYQAPKTPHVWEHKQVNEAKFNKLIKLIQQHGEKAALAEWDEVYFSQAQIYMRELELTRHYLTVCSPGNRAMVSCRTEYQAKPAKALLGKAEGVITSDRPPIKLREDPTWYQCKWCDFHPICHGDALPAVNCRTCAHSTARLNPEQRWTCELKQPAIDAPDQPGCDHHAFHPDLVSAHAEAIAADPKTGVITFRRRGDEATWDNGINGLKSRDWLAQQQPAATPEAPIEDDVRASLAMEMMVEYQDLVTGKLDESDFSRMPPAVKRLSTAWEGDSRRQQALRAILEQVDAAWLALSERVQVRVTS